VSEQFAVNSINQVINIKFRTWHTTSLGLSRYTAPIRFLSSAVSWPANGIIPKKGVKYDKCMVLLTMCTQGLTAHGKCYLPCACTRYDNCKKSYCLCACTGSTALQIHVVAIYRAHMRVPSSNGSCKLLLTMRNCVILVLIAWMINTDRLILLFRLSLIYATIIPEWTPWDSIVNLS